jgi:hypothetical protein
MQWLDFVHGACIGAGRALAIVTIDALQGTGASAMTIRYVHQVLDRKREAQAKEVKKIQGKMRVQYCRDEETAKKTEGERPPRPDYEEVWERPSELKNQIQGLVKTLTALSDEIFAQIGLDSDEVEMLLEAHPKSQDNAQLGGFEFDATSLEWKQWQALVNLVKLTSAADSATSRAEIQVCSLSHLVTSGAFSLLRRKLNPPPLLICMLVWRHVTQSPNVHEMASIVMMGPWVNLRQTRPTRPVVKLRQGP